jgi:uncharacterized protein YdaU (DUF1376 family)
MSKDPAVLFFINDWLTSTAEMDADVRGWYLNLLLHNYDKKDLPNDIEKLAVLCNVKFSEYERFKQVFEQVLKQKFEVNEFNRLSNERTNDILKSRENFKDKRSNAGKVSYIMKYMAKNHVKEYKDFQLRNFVKDNFDYSIDLKNEQMLKQVFKQMFELYINENENEIENIIKPSNDIEKTKNFEFYEILVNSESWLESVAMQSKHKLNITQVKKYLLDFKNDCDIRFDFKTSKSDFSSHFVRWLSKQEEIVKPKFDPFSGPIA